MIKARLSPEVSAVPLLQLGTPAVPPPELLGPGVFVVPAPPPEPIPRLVRMFWDAQESDVPSWRRESEESRAQRKYLESLGAWPGEHNVLGSC